MSDFINESLGTGKKHQDQIVEEFLEAKKTGKIPQDLTIDSILRQVRKMAQRGEIKRCGEGMYQRKLEAGKGDMVMTAFMETKPNEKVQ